MPDHTAPLRGDEAALFARYQPRLLRPVRAAVRTTDANAQDACATAWAILLRRQPDRDRNVYGWLCTTAIHEALRLERRTHRDLTLDPDHESGEPTREPAGGVEPEREVAARETLRSLAVLPARQRRLLGLLASGHSYHEIAALTGDTRRTVERQLMRAKARLRTVHGA